MYSQFITDISIWIQKPTLPEKWADEKFSPPLTSQDRNEKMYMAKQHERGMVFLPNGSPTQKALVQATPVRGKRNIWKTQGSWVREHSG